MKKKFKAKISGMFDIVQNNDIIISVDFGHGNDITVKTTAKVHEDGRLEILKSERIGRTRDIKQEHRDRIYARILECSKRLVVRRWLMNGMKMCKG